MQDQSVHVQEIRGDQVEAEIAATRGSAISTDRGPAIAGDSNIVAHIVNIYRTHGGSLSEADYRAALDRYLAWVCAATDRVVLRGIKRGGSRLWNCPSIRSTCRWPPRRCRKPTRC